MTDRNQARILEATLGVIVKAGAGAVRYRDVAAQAGVALGTVSYQYPTREALIRATFEYFLERNAESLRAFSASVRVKTVAELGALIANIVRAEILDPKRLRLVEFELMVSAARDPALAPLLAAYDRTLVAELGALVESVGGTAPFSTALSILELTRGFQLTALSQPDPNFHDLEKRIIRLLEASPARAPEVKKESASVRVRRKRT